MRMVPPDCSNAALLLWIFFMLFMLHACPCYALLSVPCTLVITCWESADHLALLCVVFSCVLLLSIWYPGLGMFLDCIDS